MEVMNNESKIDLKNILFLNELKKIKELEIESQKKEQQFTDYKATLNEKEENIQKINKSNNLQKTILFFGNSIIYINYRR